MPSFKPYQPNILGEHEKERVHQVIKIDHGAQLAVSEYEVGKIGGLQRGEGMQAVTGKFRLNSLQRETLGIDHEEEQRLEQSIQDRIRHEVEGLRQKAFEEGKQAGFEAGREEIKKQLEDGATQNLAKLDAFVTAFEQASGEVFKQNEKFLVRLAGQIGKMLALKEIQTDEAYLVRLFQQIIEKIGIREHVRMKVNPRDEKAAFAMKKELETRMTDLRNLMIEASEEVVEGGCILETDWNLVDARIETQIKQIQKSLLNRGDDGVEST